MVFVLMFVNRMGIATLISKPMVYTMEALKAFASTMKTDMTVKAPQGFATIVIQNAEEVMAQPLVKLSLLDLSVLDKNVLMNIIVVKNLTVNSVNVFILVDR